MSDALVITASPLALMSAIIFAAAYFAIPRFRHYSSHFVLFLLLCDAGVALSIIFDSSIFPMCDISASVLHLSLLASLLWQCSIAVNNALRVTYPFDVTKNDLKRRESWVHVVCWGLPLLLTVLFWAPSFSESKRRSQYVQCM
jgi:hypothetical protein